MALRGLSTLTVLMADRFSFSTSRQYSSALVNNRAQYKYLLVGSKKVKETHRKGNNKQPLDKTRKIYENFEFIASFIFFEYFAIVLFPAN